MLEIPQRSEIKPTALQIRAPGFCLSEEDINFCFLPVLHLPLTHTEFWYFLCKHSSALIQVMASNTITFLMIPFLILIQNFKWFSIRATSKNQYCSNYYSGQHYDNSKYACSNKPTCKLVILDSKKNFYMH